MPSCRHLKQKHHGETRNNGWKNHGPWNSKKNGKGRRKFAAETFGFILILLFVLLPGNFHRVQTHTHKHTHTHAKTFPQTWKSTQQWEFEWVDVGRRTSGCYKRLNLSKLLLPTPSDVPPFHVHVHVDASGSVILFSPSSFSLPTNCQSTNHPHLPPFNHHSFVLCATPRSSLRLPAPPPAHFWQLFGNHFRVWMTRSFSSSRGK